MMLPRTAVQFWPTWVVAVAAGVAWLGSSRPFSLADTAQEPGQKTDSAHHWLGAISCAAAACHNANGPAGTQGSEYSTWITADPHAQAYAVLSNERSKRIERNLWPGTERKAKDEQSCLACHVGPDVITAAKDRQFHTDGVSCESCHGAAEQWRTKHYLQGWKDKSSADKEKLGMKPTKDLVERARLCAGCHVGSGERDVNHDLIAAGHPRLNFEFGAYLANMPKHWDDRKEKKEDPGFEARVWVIGQVVAAQEAAELLAYRADAKNKKPWPEFAEYDCFACHHDLQARSWRQTRSTRLGALDWGSWYYSPMLELALSSEQGGFPKGISDLRKEMKKPYPDPAVVRQLADAAGTELGQQLTALAREASERTMLTKRLRARVDKARVSTQDSNWDGAAQRYLALAAFYQGLEDLGVADAEARPELLRLRKMLGFPVGYDSPRSFNPFSR
jgi:hypothetical protein